MDFNKTLSNLMPYLIITAVVAVLLNSYFIFSLAKNTNYAFTVTDQKIGNVAGALENSSNYLAGKINEESAERQLSVDKVRKEGKESVDALQKLVTELEQTTSLNLQEIQQDLKSIAVSSADFSVIIQDVLPGVVSVTTNLGGGSGAIVSNDGYIVTNYHVVQGASIITVTTSDGKNHPATVIGFHGGHDVAAIKMDGSFTALEFGSLDSVAIGEAVIAVGNPSGLGFTVTEGIVSAKRMGSNNVVYIQTDVPINPGNSGGPLINKEGQIIGLNNFKVQGTEGLGFAINSDTVKQDYNEIKNAAGS